MNVASWSFFVIFCPVCRKAISAQSRGRQLHSLPPPILPVELRVRSNAQCTARPRFVLEIDVSKLLPVVVPHDEAGRLLFDGSSNAHRRARRTSVAAAQRQSCVVAPIDCLQRSRGGLGTHRYAIMASAVSGRLTTMTPELRWFPNRVWQPASHRDTKTVPIEESLVFPR
jgi:hypothetical protein